MAKYITQTSILATIDGQEMTIPVDKGNRHYAELIASGVEIEPLVVPTKETPEELLPLWRVETAASQAQIRLTLHNLGLLNTVQAMADSDPAISIVWEYADEIRRNSPFIDALKADKFTDEQIDDIFKYALTLKF